MDPKEQLYELKGRIESMEHSITQMSKQFDMVSDLISSVKVLATEMKHLRESTNNIDHRLKALEKEPLEKFNQIKMTITSCVITTIIGALLGSLVTLVIK